MVQSAHSRRLLIATLLLGLVVISACSKSDSTTSPGPGATTKELNSPTLGNGGVYVDTLATAGTFPYHCSFHPQMTAQVVVDAGSANTTAAISITGFTFTPANVTVKTGGIITWTNNDNSNHTVTSD